MEISAEESTQIYSKLLQATPRDLLWCVWAEVSIQAFFVSFFHVLESSENPYQYSPVQESG